MEDIHNLINIGPTNPIQSLNQHDFFLRFCMCNSNYTFDKNKKYYRLECWLRFVTPCWCCVTRTLNQLMKFPSHTWLDRTLTWSSLCMHMSWHLTVLGHLQTHCWLHIVRDIPLIYHISFEFVSHYASFSQLTMFKYPISGLFLHIVVK